jgi:hypothetical protein
MGLSSDSKSKTRELGFQRKTKRRYSRHFSDKRKKLNQKAAKLGLRAMDSGFTSPSVLLRALEEK